MSRSVGSGHALRLITVAHVLVGEPVSTLGSSPRAGFAGTCASLAQESSMRMLRSLVTPMAALVVALAVSLGTSQAETNKIRIGKVIGGNGFHIPSYVAMDQGFYKSEGLDAEFVVLQGRPLVTAALSGNVDFIPIPSGGAQAALSGAEIRYVVGESLRSQWTIVVRPEIGKMEDLKGKTVGYGRAG